MDVGTLDALRQHCERTQDFATLAEGLERAAKALSEALGDPTELGARHLELGHVYRDRLGRADRAIAHYRTAIDFDPAQRTAMQAARALFAQAGKWDQVAKLLGREAESLPQGPKKAALLVELARVARGQLADVSAAATALREAIVAHPGDLQVQHDLATMLLEESDRVTDAGVADRYRREAADVLCGMAKSVNDDYAFAYIEAALDAVPDHADALSLIETVAPKVGRTDTIPPRWVAGLQIAPLGPLARGLRLKLARAYAEVGQSEDARLCLEPLLTQGDIEALALDSQLFEPSGAPSAPPGPDEAASLPLVLTADTEPPPPRKPSAAPVSEHEVSLLSEEQELETTPSEERALDALSSVEQGLAASPSEERVLAQLSSEEQDVADTDLPDEKTPARVFDAEALLLASERKSRERLSLTTTDATVVEARIPTAEAAPAALAPEAPARPSEAPARSSEAPARSRESAGRASQPVARPSEPAPPALSPEEAALAQLYGAFERKQRYRDLRGAADLGEQILARVPTDPRAITAIEDYCRATRDFRRMRDLSRRLAGEEAIPLEARLVRLREVAMLSESKLGDIESTIDAYRKLVALSPRDEEGREKLRKLLTRSQRWDELAQFLADDAQAEQDARARAELWRELAAVQRDKRQQRDAAIEAYRRAREAFPLPSDDEKLATLLLAAGRFSEAVVHLELQLAQAPVGRALSMLSTLADLYETKLADPKRSYELNERILEEQPPDEAALDRRERIDEALGRHDQLLATLGMRLAGTRGVRRVPLLLRMAELSLRLAEVDRALSWMQEALELAPEDERVIAAAERIYAQAERGTELTDLLESLAADSAGKATQLSLLRTAAKRRLAEDDVGRAISAHEAVLALGPDTDALRMLVQLLGRSGEWARDLARRLDELAGLVPEDEARELRVRRAELLAAELDDKRASLAEWSRIASELAPADLHVLDRLAALARELGEAEQEAKALERRLKLTAQEEELVRLAERLADIYEYELKRPAEALRVLERWIEVAPASPRAHFRLIPFLTAADRHQDVIRSLDVLASLAAEDEASELIVRAARVASESLGDHKGAFRRLVPRVLDSEDPAAEELLKEVARVGGYGKELAEVYVALAQRGDDPAAQARRWLDAAATYEVLAAAPDKALEAALRALSKDMDSLSMLEEVERLAVLSRSWPRLRQVYDGLVRRLGDRREQAALLVRHARLLLRDAEDPSLAFERFALAFQFEPQSAEIYEEAVRCGVHAQRYEVVLSIHEGRAESVAASEERLRALLDAACGAVRWLSDLPRATGYLSRAAVLVGADAEKLERIAEAVRAFDEAEPPLDGRGLTGAFIGVLRQRADDVRRDPGLGAFLLLRAAELLERAFDDVKEAWVVLERAATLAPTHETVLDTLEQMATRADRLETLAEHYQRAADDAIDSNTASVALWRLGGLLEGRLARPDRAAEVWKQLVMLRPRDLEASDRLRICLRAAGRHKDQLMAIDRELSICKDDEDKRISLLTEAAETWENDLGIRFEALDAWKKVLAIDPENEQAAAALARLGKKEAVDERSLLSDEVIVRPEDLHPNQRSATISSLRPPRSASTQSAAAVTIEPVQGDEALPARGSVPTEAAQAAIESDPSSEMMPANSGSERQEVAVLLAPGSADFDPAEVGARSTPAESEAAPLEVAYDGELAEAMPAAVEAVPLEVANEEEAAEAAPAESEAAPLEVVRHAEEHARERNDDVTLVGLDDPSTSSAEENESSEAGSLGSDGGDPPASNGSASVAERSLAVPPPPLAAGAELSDEPPEFEASPATAKPLRLSIEPAALEEQGFEPKSVSAREEGTMTDPAPAPIMTAPPGRLSEESEEAVLVESSELQLVDRNSSSERTSDTDVPDSDDVAVEKESVAARDADQLAALNTMLERGVLKTNPPKRDAGASQRPAFKASIPPPPPPPSRASLPVAPPREPEPSSGQSE